MKERVSVILAIFLITATFGLLIGPIIEADGAVLRVGEDQTYSSIQTAINSANPGDTVEVFAGTYYENIVVNRTITLKGNGTGETFIVGDGSDDVVTVTSDWVNISGIMATTYGIGTNAGIRIDSDTDKVKIENCNLSYNYYGVQAYGSSSSIIDDLKIMNSTANWTQYGFYIRYCDNALLRNNTANNNDDYGIYFYYSDYGKVENNTCNYNNYGIRPYYADNSEFRNNSLTGNDYGIYSYYSDFTGLHNNEVRESYDWGIYMYISDDTRAENNTIIDSGYPFSTGGDFGLEVYASENARIQNNTFTRCGAYMDQSSSTDWTSLVIKDNQVNSRDLRFYSGTSGVTVPSGTGQVIMYDCNDIDIVGMDLSNASVGVQAYASWSIEVENCDLGYNYMGIEIDDSSTDMVYNNITGSYFNMTRDTAIRLYTSSEDAAHNIIDGNHIRDGDLGIEMDVSFSSTDSGYYNRIRNNTIVNMTDYGIDVEYIGYSNISNNMIIDADDGIYFSAGSSSKNHYNTIENNTIEGGGYGMRSYYNYYSTIKNNSISKTDSYGIYFYYADYADIGDNHIENIDGEGFYITGTDNAFFHGNTIKNATEGGIYISSGGSNSFRYNTFINCGFDIGTTSTTYWSTNTIDTTNKVNGDDVVIIYNTNNPTIPSTVGQIMLHTSDNADIDGIRISNITVGIWLYNSDGVTIENSVLENMATGLDIDTCANLRIMNNTIANMTNYGLYHDDSDGAHIFNNTFKDCGYPYHTDGYYGAYLYYSQNLDVENNSFERCGAYVYGSTTSSYYTSHDFSNNTVNGRELAYLSGNSSMTLSGSYGQVLIYNSDNITVKDTNLSTATFGVHSVFSTNINITNVSANWNYRGIYFDPNQDSKYNRFENLSCNWNHEEGLLFDSSSTYDAHHILIANSTFNWNGDNGIDLDYIGDYPIVKNNVMGNNTNYGLEMDGASTTTISYANITDNLMEFNGWQGAYLDYTLDAIIENNVFKNNSDYGLDLYHGDNSDIINNTANGNLLEGIYVHYAENVDIMYNEVMNNHDHGIQVYRGLQTAFNGEIAWNNISMNDGYGMDLDSDYHDVNNNTFYRNTEYGLYVSGTYGEDNVIVSNYFLSNNMGGKQALDDEGENDWDNGTHGNYWSDHQVPDLDRDGIVDIAYSIPGSAGETDRYPLIIGNVPPLITNDDITEATPGTVYSNDYNATDADDDTLTWSVTSNATFLSIASDTGILFGIPKTEDAVSQFWVNVTVSDGNGGKDWSNFTLFVGEANAPPEITTVDVTTVNEDSFYSVDYNATDIDEDPLTWSLDTNATFLSINSTNGYLNGTPTNDDVGSYWVNVSVSDGNGGMDWSNFTLTVLNTNDPPEILTDPLTIATEDLLYTVDFMAQDIDPTNDVLTWSLMTDADFLTVNPTTGVVSGIPGDTGVGTWWVNVSVSDGNGGMDWLNYTLVVLNINDPPVITNPIDGTYDWNEDMYNEIDFEAEDVDPDDTSDNLVWSLTTNADWLTMDQNTGVLSGQPTNAQVGDWDVTVTVTDTGGLSDSNDFTIRVVNTNDPPVINQAFLGETMEDEPFWYVFQANDPDPTDDTLTWSLDTNAEFLTIDPVTGNVSGTPTNDDVGFWYVNVSVSDGNGGTDFLNVTLEVLNVNDDPIIMTESIPDAVEDEFYSYVFEAVDIDPTFDVITWSIDSTNADFISIQPGTGNMTFLPTNAHVGEYYVVVMASDPFGGTDTVNFTFRVINVNDDPIIVTDSLPFATEDEEYWYLLNGTDVDPTDDTLVWSVINTSQEFLFLDSATGNLSGTPTDDDVGTWWINISLEDEIGGMTWKNFTITVINVNDPPELNMTDISLTIEEDAGSVELDLNDVFVDPDGDVLIFDYEVGENFTVSIVDGVATITPVADFEGTEMIMFMASDGETTMSINVSVTVTGVNDPPFNLDVDYEATYTEGGDQIVSASAEDPEGDELTFTWSSNVTGTIGTGSQINLSLVAGVHTITVVATDPDGASVQETFEVTILEGEVEEPEEDGEDDEFPWWIIILIIVILLILIVIIVIVVLARRRGEEEEEGTIREEYVEQSETSEERPPSGMSYAPETEGYTEQAVYEEMESQSPPSQPVETMEPYGEEPMYEGTITEEPELEPVPETEEPVEEPAGAYPPVEEEGIPAEEEETTRPSSPPPPPQPPGVPEVPEPPEEER